MSQRVYCPYCNDGVDPKKPVITDGKQKSGRRGPDKKWVRMECQACEQEFEQHLDNMVDPDAR